jgi:hypothetical protein
MDTTFRQTDSTHDVHTVACADCHPKGVPRKRASAGPRATRSAKMPVADPFGQKPRLDDALARAWPPVLGIRN